MNWSGRRVTMVVVDWEIGTTTNRSNPVQVVDSFGNPLSGVVEISATGSHTVYLKRGRNGLGCRISSSGGLGAGLTTTSSNPVQVVDLDRAPAERGGGDLRGWTHGLFEGR